MSKMHLRFIRKADASSKDSVREEDAGEDLRERTNLEEGIAIGRRAAWASRSRGQERHLAAREHPHDDRSPRSVRNLWGHRAHAGDAGLDQGP